MGRMIRNRRTPLGRVLTALLAMLAVASLVAGCSADKKAETKDRGPLPEAGPLLAKVVDSSKNLHDVQIDLSVDGQIPELPVKSVNAYLTNDPAVAGQGDADVTVNGSQIQAKFVVTGGDLWARLGTGAKYQNMGKAADIYDASAILDPKRGIAHLVAGVRDPKVAGRETIAGIDTVKLTGTVPGEALRGLVPKSSVGDRPVTFWVQEDAPNNLVRANVEFAKGTLVVNLSNWGQKVTLTDPKTGS